MLQFFNSDGERLSEVVTLTLNEALCFAGAQLTEKQANVVHLYKLETGYAVIWSDGERWDGTTFRMRDFS